MRYKSRQLAFSNHEILSQFAAPPDRYYRHYPSEQNHINGALPQTHQEMPRRQSLEPLSLRVVESPRGQYVQPLAEHCDFASVVLVEVMLGTADDDIRLDADLAQLGN